MTYIRTDQGDVRVAIDGVAIAGSWATAAGGDVTAADAKTRPGALGSEVSVGGQATRNDLTLTTQWTDELLGQYKWIAGRCGRGLVKASKNWINKEGVPFPNGLFTRTGTLKGVNEPDYDHNGNAVGFLQLVVSCDEDLA